MLIFANITCWCHYFRRHFDADVIDVFMPLLYDAATLLFRWYHIFTLIIFAIYCFRHFFHAIFDAIIFDYYFHIIIIFIADYFRCFSSFRYLLLSLRRHWYYRYGFADAFDYFDADDAAIFSSLIFSFHFLLLHFLPMLLCRYHFLDALLTPFIIFFLLHYYYTLIFSPFLLHFFHAWWYCYCRCWLRRYADAVIIFFDIIFFLYFRYIIFLLAIFTISPCLRRYIDYIADYADIFRRFYFLRRCREMPFFFDADAADIYYFDAYVSSIIIHTPFDVFATRAISLLFHDYFAMMIFFAMHAIIAIIIIWCHFLFFSCALLPLFFDDIFCRFWYFQIRLYFLVSMIFSSRDDALIHIMPLRLLRFSLLSFFIDAAFYYFRLCIIYMLFRYYYFILLRQMPYAYAADISCRHWYFLCWCRCRRLFHFSMMPLCHCYHYWLLFLFSCCADCHAAIISWYYYHFFFIDAVFLFIFATLRCRCCRFHFSSLFTYRCRFAISLFHWYYFALSHYFRPMLLPFSLFSITLTFYVIDEIYCRHLRISLHFSPLPIVFLADMPAIDFLRLIIFCFHFALPLSDADVYFLHYFTPAIFSLLFFFEYAIIFIRSFHYTPRHADYAAIIIILLLLIIYYSPLSLFTMLPLIDAIMPPLHIFFILLLLLNI